MFQILKPLFGGLVSLAVTWQNGVGYRSFDVSMTGMSLAMLLTAVMLLLISGIMAQGCKLKEEHSLTI